MVICLVSLVNIASVSDFYDGYDQSSVFDPVNDPVNALADTIAFLTGKLFAASRTRIIG